MSGQSKSGNLLQDILRSVNVQSAQSAQSRNRSVQTYTPQLAQTAQSLPPLVTDVQQTFIDHSNQITDLQNQITELKNQITELKQRNVGQDVTLFNMNNNYTALLNDHTALRQLVSSLSDTVRLLTNTHQPMQQQPMQQQVQQQPMQPMQPMQPQPMQQQVQQPMQQQPMQQQVPKQVHFIDPPTDPRRISQSTVPGRASITAGRASTPQTTPDYSQPCRYWDSVSCCCKKERERGYGFKCYFQHPRVQSRDQRDARERPY